MTARWPALTDDLVRAALTESLPAGLTDVVFEELTAMIARTPQRRRALTLWPWSPALPSVRSASRGRRRLDAVATLVGLALLVAAVVAAIVLVGSAPRVPPLGSSGLIAFAAGGEIWVANADGSGPRQITSDAQQDVQPTFSPDGRRLAYKSLDVANSTVSLVVTDPDGTDRIVVATSPAVDRASGTAIGWYRVAWSPDGGRLAYAAPVRGTQQLFVVAATGGYPRQIGDPALEGHDPVWSPDGTRIAFIGGHFDTEKGVYVMGADGSAPRRLGPMPDGQWASEADIPVWSPDGTSIAFSARTDSTFRVFVDALDGTGPRAVSADVDQDARNATWSPDGRRLAWITRSSTGDWQFVVAALDGSVTSVLPPAVTGGPVWSPDGTRLLGYRTDVAIGRPDRLILVDVADGSAIEVPAQPEGEASWQWLAP